MAESPAAPVEVDVLEARVRRLELEAREAEARFRTYDFRLRLDQLRAANPSKPKSA
jgi:hypothetical protein